MPRQMFQEILRLIAELRRSHHPRQHEAFDYHAFKSNRQEEGVQMPVKIARSSPRPSFGLPELLVAIHTSCSKAGQARIFALVCGSSEESRAREAQRMKNAAELSLLAAADGRRRDCRRDKA